MKIKLWQAFASNNSGSYTIVGSFASPEKARAVADALREMSVAHAGWLEAAPIPSTGQDSPLAAFCREHGLPWEEGLGARDDWPEHDETNVPAILATGHQVLVHVAYTITMPPTFGAFFYKNGGRVAVELDHAHGPIVATVTAWWRERDQAEARATAVIAELTAPGGVLVTACSTWEHPPAWRTHDHGLHGDLILACVFDDLCGGVAAVKDVVGRHGGSSHVEIAELHHHANPTVGLRPSHPPSATPRFDVWIDALKKTPQLRAALAKALGTYESSVDPALARAPGAVFECLFEPAAQRIAAVLEAHGVKHGLHPVP